MFSISEQELKDLIDKHYNKSSVKDRIPEYDLKTAVECGLMFLYGKNHLKNGKIENCTVKFDLYKKHKCINKSIKVEEEASKKIYNKNNFIEILETKTLEKTKNTLKSCWTGYNLAILTSDFTIQGYFKKDLLFQKKLPEACSIVAGADKICIGLFSGEIIYFDPISQNEVYKPCHTDVITSLSYENGHVLSSSLDGSIFYKKKMVISEAGILNSQYISDDKFLCSSKEHKIIFYDSGEIKTFMGHKDLIKGLSYNRFGLSSSKNGEVGFLFNENSFELENINASLHKRSSLHRFYGYGLSDVFLYDVNQRQKIWEIKERSLNLTIKDNLLVYSLGKKLKMVDVRSKESFELPFSSVINDLSFSGSGDMLLISTNDSPIILDYRCL